MDIFKDKKFEEMDWVSQACEPYIDPRNEILAKLPDELNIDLETMIINPLAASGHINISRDDIVRTMMQTANINYRRIAYDHREQIRDCFDFTVELENGHNDIVVDLETKTITGGTIRFVKVKQFFDNKESAALIGKDGISHLRHKIQQERKYITGANANEILELLGDFTTIRDRSIKRKTDTIISHMKEIMLENKWNIRDIELSN